MRDTRLLVKQPASYCKDAEHFRYISRMTLMSHYAPPRGGAWGYWRFTNRRIPIATRSCVFFVGFGIRGESMVHSVRRATGGI